MKGIKILRSSQVKRWKRDEVTQVILDCQVLDFKLHYNVLIRLG